MPVARQVSNSLFGNFILFPKKFVDNSDGLEAARSVSRNMFRSGFQLDIAEESSAGVGRIFAVDDSGCSRFAGGEFDLRESHLSGAGAIMHVLAAIIPYT